MNTKNGNLKMTNYMKQLAIISMMCIPNLSLAFAPIVYHDEEVPVTEVHGLVAPETQQIIDGTGPSLPLVEQPDDDLVRTINVVIGNVVRTIRVEDFHNQGGLEGIVRQMLRNNN